ncbi:MAG: CRISPR-associated endonuclease Cas3'', partial [Gammaproteobacteria bacterium]
HVALMDGEDPSLVDVAESAFRAARSRPVLRIHPALSAHWSDVPGWASVLDSFSSSAEEWGIEEWREALRELRSRLDDSDPRCRTVSDLLSLGFTVQAYPNGSGVVFAGRRRLPSVWFTPALDEGDDSLSRIDDRQPVPLDDHIEHVHDVLEEFLARLPLERWRSALEAAVLLHDIGKADERFQALLLGQDRTTSWLHAGMSGRARPLAKSEGLPLSPGERALAGRRAGVPQGFRHEMLSLQLAECAEESPLPSDEWARDLALHLVSAHHGHARPFAPVALDRDPPRVEVEIRPAGRVIKAALEGRWRCTHPPHRPNSGIAERFWRLVRQHGWWGLAYLEAVVRLADQLASARESSCAYSRSAGAASSEDDGVQS